MCDILARLPHVEQLLLQLVKHGWAKEVEALCGGLGHMATLLPLAAAQQLSGWTLNCCDVDDVASPLCQACFSCMRQMHCQYWLSCFSGCADCRAPQNCQGALHLAPGPCRSVQALCSKTSQQPPHILHALHCIYPLKSIPIHKSCGAAGGNDMELAQSVTSAVCSVLDSTALSQECRGAQMPCLLKVLCFLTVCMCHDG